MNKNIKKKKKGFTLIELVIVLAVLAIIAMIAIPNFTRVRNKALIDGDIRSAEQIEKITLMALANGDIPTEEKEYAITFTDDKKVAVEDPEYKELLRDVKAPQVPGTTGYTVKVDESGAVGVGYSAKPTFENIKQGLAGTLVNVATISQ